MTNKFGSNLVGGSGFWNSYAESIVSNITNGHERLTYLTEIKKRYEYLVNHGYGDVHLCRGCNFHFPMEATCNVCAEFFCSELSLPQCTLRECTRCRHFCCLSDRTFTPSGNLVCIDCVDYHGTLDVDNEDGSMSLYSDSEEEEEVSSEEE